MDMYDNMHAIGSCLLDGWVEFGRNSENTYQSSRVHYLDFMSIEKNNSREEKIGTIIIIVNRWSAPVDRLQWYYYYYTLATAHL